MCVCVPNERLAFNGERRRAGLLPVLHPRHRVRLLTLTKLRMGGWRVRRLCYHGFGWRELRLW